MWNSFSIKFTEVVMILVVIRVWKDTYKRSGNKGLTTKQEEITMLTDI